MYEVRFHGRGGQGAVMAAQALAAAAFHEGNYALAFPFFGAERRGAPVLAFTRVDSKKIRQRTQVYKPDIVVVLDDKLMGYVDVTAGLKDGGLLIVNSPLPPEKIKTERPVKTATVDATGVALEILGAPVTNSAVLGAIAKATGLVKIASVERGIMDVFGARLGEKGGRKNADAAKKSFEKTIMGTSTGGRKFKATKKWLPDYKEMPLALATRVMDIDGGKAGPGSFIMNKTGSWRTFAPLLDEAKCTNCLICWFYCPDGAIKRGEKKVKIDYDYCKGCGICVEVCGPKALAWVRTEEVDEKLLAGEVS